MLVLKFQEHLIAVKILAERTSLRFFIKVNSVSVESKFLPIIQHFHKVEDYLNFISLKTQINVMQTNFYDDTEINVLFFEVLVTGKISCPLQELSLKAQPSYCSIHCSIYYYSFLT